MEAAPPWLAELALAAASSTASARCAERFVEAAVRVAGARAVFVFATRREAGALELLAASAANSGAAAARLPLGGEPVVGTGHADFRALSLFAIRSDGTFLRITAGPMAHVLVLVPRAPTDAEFTAWLRAAEALGNMLACALVHERTSPPPALVPEEPSPFDSDELERASGVFVAAERVDRDRRRTEVFLESVIENIPDMIFVKDAVDLRFVRFNRAGEKLLGWSREHLIGKSDRDFFPAEEAEFFLAKDREVIASGGLVDIPEEPIQTARGRRFLHTKKLTIHDERGAPLYLLGISEDITEKKLAREALAEREARFQNLFRGAPVSLWELDAKAARPELEALRSTTSGLTVRVRRVFESIRTLSVNEATLRLFAAPDAESIQHRLPELLGTGRHGGSLVEALLELADGASVVEREITGQRLDATPLSLLLRVTVPDDARHDLSYVLLSLTDVSALKAAEAKLEHTAEELRRSNGELQQFAYVASHDLQEPLRIITGFSELLTKSLGDRLTQDDREYLEFIVDAAGRMQRLIRDLLAYARVDSKATRPEPTPLGRPLSDALANLRVAIDESGARVEIEPDPLPEVDCDPGQLGQVFQNLIGNAIKFRGAAAPLVRIRATHADAHLTITVADNGIGFDPQYRERIFEVFQRLHGVGRYPGTGIGLALCKKIIERHGGTITADSVPGHGTTFRFTLPVRESRT
jgi:PAS domain S-box-containing protein